jgi:hypothetical protein
LQPKESAMNFCLFVLNINWENKTSFVVIDL